MRYSMRATRDVAVQGWAQMQALLHSHAAAHFGQEKRMSRRAMREAVVSVVLASKRAAAAARVR